ncbi:MAG: response regulator [Spirochaetaceae bacterium]|nr:response regulator [Spirochaetaceae bacterium]
MNKLKVMLVEDEAVVLEGYKKLFDWEGRGCAVVCEVGDGLSAVSLADRYRPDIILMDINIPLLSGLDAIDAIKKRLPDTVFIIISGYNEFDYAQKAIRLRVAEYLLKPVKFDELAKVMDRIRRDLLNPRGAGSRRKDEAEGKRIYKIISYLHEHITETISLKKLSEEFFLHPVYISQLFKEETGMNYHDYLIRLRIDRAKKILSTSDLSISQIAAITGFPDYRCFSQAFKRFEKKTPSVFKDEYRRIRN